MNTMDTTKVFLVRHAQTRWNVTGRYMGWIDEGLSDEGLWQAEQLSRRLKNWSIDSAYSSPLKRAYETAQIIAKPHALQVCTMHELGEIRIGYWEGMYRDDVKSQYPEIWQAWRSDPSTVQMPNGENMSQVQERAVAAFQDIIGANIGHQVLIVTHEVIVKLLIAYCLDINISMYRRFEIANASLTIVQLIGNRYHLSSLNDTGHLDK